MKGVLSLNTISHHTSFSTLLFKVGCWWIIGLVPNHSLYGNCVIALFFAFPTINFKNNTQYIL
jgi:hypothetical protein